MIDILFLTHGRTEFMRESLAALLANTDWTKVRRLVMYDEAVAGLGGPVAVMNHYLKSGNVTPIFAKIDDDTMVPPGWLGECLQVMEENPKLDLLGIEAHYPVVAGVAPRSYKPAQFIGGIGLMRSSCFRSLPRAQGRFGFTAWQDTNAQVVKGWISPALPVFLLDRIPFAPWAEHSREYVRQGLQRDWPAYDPAVDGDKWAWWRP